MTTKIIATAAVVAVCAVGAGAVPQKGARSAPSVTMSNARLNALKKEATADIDSTRDFTQQMVDQIFSYGELGFQEFETSRYLTHILEKNGFAIQRNLSGIPTAWMAAWGSGKPIIAIGSDIDCIPQASQKPGVAYHDPIIEGAPGHGEGHNSGQAVNITAILAVKKIMDKYHIAGTIRLYPGVAEELVATKAFMVRAGLFKDVDVVLGCHVANEFATHNGQTDISTGLISVLYSFHGTA